MNTRRVAYIEISRLHPHKNNPRKDLGDLTELSESIRRSGVMQNLTVVPIEGQPEDYTIVIGHRRHGAAKLAGLTFLPCIVTDMDEKEQLATMMLENMQRSDLTILEQAEGFQLMMDLGESVESIAEKTGLSKTTVRNRVKLTRYDRAILRDAAVRQPTMEQYMRLSEIEDISVANDVARFLGTKNFDAEVDKAIRRQKENKATNEAKALIKGFATKIADTSWSALQEAGLVSVTSFYPPYDGLKAKLDKLAKDGGEYFYSYGYGFTIYRKKTQEDESAEEARKAKVRAREELTRRASDISNAMIERADAFVKEYHCNGKHDAEILRQWIFRCAVKNMFAPNNIDDVAETLGWDKPEDYCPWVAQEAELPREYVLCKYENEEKRSMLMLLWYGTVRRDRRDAVCHLPYNGHTLNLADASANAWIERFMLLEELGYNISTEEWSFLNGKHPIYSEEVPL